MDHSKNSRGRGRKTAQFYQPPPRKVEEHTNNNLQPSAHYQGDADTNPHHENRIPDTYDNTLNRMKKPEQVFYTAKPLPSDQPHYMKKDEDNYQHNTFKHQQNNRDLRHTSEPRAVVPGNSKQNYYNPMDRTRDTRSVEPNRGEKKPPINSRNNGMSAHRLPSNIDSLPPRLQRKHLAECGLPEDWLEKQQQQYKKDDNNSYNNQGYNNNRHSQQQNWSQTLPMPPKGRSARDGGGIYRNQYKDEYSSGAGGGAGGRSRSRSSDRRHDEEYFPKPRSRNPSNDKKGGGDGGGGGGQMKNWRYDNSSQPPAPQNFNNNNNNNRFQNQRKSFQKVDTRNMESVETIEKNLKSSSMAKQQQQQHQKPYQPQKQHFQPSADMMAAKQKSPGREDEMMGKQSAFEISYFNWAEDVEETMATKEEVKPNNQNRQGGDNSYRQRNRRKGKKKKNRNNSHASNDGFQESEKAKKHPQQQPPPQQQQQQHRPQPHHPQQPHHQQKLPQHHQTQQPPPLQEDQSLNNRERDGFKVPFKPQHQHKPQRSRKNSQSSVYSRETSAERGMYSRTNAPIPPIYGNPRNRRNSGNFINSRENSSERFRDNSRSRFVHPRSRRNSERFNSMSRESSNDRGNWNKPTDPQPSSWRAKPRDDMISQATEKITKDFQNVQMSEANDIAEMTRQFEDAVELRKGVLVLPQQQRPQQQQQQQHSQSSSKVLFDPSNPDKPIVLMQAPTRVNYNPPENLHEINNVTSEARKKNLMLTKASLTDQYINMKPLWYDPHSEGYRSVKKFYLIDRMENVDLEMQLLIGSGNLFKEWAQFWTLRLQLQEIMEQLIKFEMKFCQQENVEHHCWKLLYYNVIELLRKSIIDDTNNSLFYKERILEIIESGNVYLLHLLAVLEISYKFRLEDFLGENAGTNNKGLKYIGLALVSAQKLFLFLGDLARYSEQINETQNYAIAKQWYLKAQQVVPKNGRPYNQLALLSVYSKCKLDAVYYYMRSLMSSNPFQSGRESLIALFDETRKKYESLQRKRDEKARLRLKEKEHKFDGGNLRRETWIHPEGGRRVHRTAPLDPLAGHAAGDTSDEEELKQMDIVEIKKRFITSFLHVQGKLITKIGMETFTQCSIQMLREFHLLINHTSSIAMNTQTLLQLMALNMFAIDSTQLRDPSIAPGARSEIQECAISIGLLMFGIILEKLIYLIRETLDPNALNKPTVIPINSPLITLGGEKLTTSSHNDTKHSNKSKPTKCDDKINERLGDSNDKIKGQMINVESNKNSICNQNENDDMSTKKRLILSENVSNLLPAVKVWCDWMLCHTNVWNPPPFCSDYKICTKGTHDPWTGLANLMTILDTVDTNRGIISLERHKDYQIVRLEEDITLAYFTPLMYNSPEPIFCHCNEDKEIAQNALRLQKLIFFGTDFLCSCNPPVLKKITTDNDSNTKFISIVQDRTEGASDTEIMLESFSDDEDNETVAKTKVDPSTNTVAQKQADTVSDINRVIRQISSEVNENEKNVKTNSKQNEVASEIRRLLRRKDELERKQKMQDKYNQRLQDILNQSTVALNIEVRPKFLVPDTNCFVDYLTEIKAIAAAHPLYQLMVPLVVINELEGLSRGFRAPAANPSSLIKNPLAPTLTIFSSSSKNTNTNRVSNHHNPEHAVRVADASQNALSFLKSKNPAIKCITTKGSVLSSSIFTVEDDGSEQKSNDDKILDTALNLCKNSTEERKGEMRFLVRDVVLFTNDRNLRVKALSNDLPVRELLDFIKWAGLGSQFLTQNRR